MKIDYSLPQYSPYMLCADANIRFGARHIMLSLSNQLALSVCERICHFVLGFFMCLLPIVGHLMAVIDYLAGGRTQVIHLNQSSSYKRGVEFGSKMRSEIQMIYALVHQKIEERKRSSYDGEAIFNRAVEHLQKHVEMHILLEMQGLAKGAGVELASVFQVHTFIDIYAGESGCSAVASLKGKGKLQRVSAANHFASMAHQEGNSETLSRKKDLDVFPLSTSVDSHKKLLGKVSKDFTIQSVVFDANRREINLATAWGDAAHTLFKRFLPFNASWQRSAPSVKLARNLDWPWAFLAPYTILVVHESKKKKFVNVTFPGYVGVLTAMNEDGVAIACCQSGKQKQDEGEPITLLFRRVIENASSAREAEELLRKSRPASSMNLTVAAPDGIFSAELDPSREASGYAAIH